MQSFKQKNLLLTLEITELHKQIYSLFNSNSNPEKIIKESSKLFKDAISAYDKLIKENSSKIEINKRIIECNNLDLKSISNKKSTKQSCNDLEKVTANSEDLINNNKFLEREIRNLQILYSQYKKQRSSLYIEQIALLENLYEDVGGVSPNSTDNLKEATKKGKVASSNKLANEKLSLIMESLNETKQNYKNAFLEEQKLKFEEAKKLLRKKTEIKKTGGAFASPYSYGIQMEIINKINTAKKRSFKRLFEDLEFFQAEYKNYEEKLFKGNSKSGEVISFSIGHFNDYRNKIKRQINKIIREYEKNLNSDGENIRELYKNRNHLDDEQFKALNELLMKNFDNTIKDLHESLGNYYKEVSESVKKLKFYMNKNYNDERDSILKRHVEVINRHLKELTSHKKEAEGVTLRWFENETNELNELLKDLKNEGAKIFEKEKSLWEKKIKDFKKKIEEVAKN